MRPQNRHRAGSDDTSNPSIQFIPSVLSLEHQPLCANHKLLFAASSSLPCQHGIDRCLLPGVRLTKIISVPSPVPDPTVALIAQDDLHLWLQTPLAWIISSPCNRVRASHRTCTPRFSATADANDPPAISAQRARRQLCRLLSLAIACRAPRHCCPLTAVLSPPPPKYSGNEEGAKMTGSIFDFASRTCASATVPRELALGAGSSGVIRVSTATSSSAASAEGNRQR